MSLIALGAINPEPVKNAIRVTLDSPIGLFKKIIFDSCERKEKTPNIAVNNCAIGILPINKVAN